MDKQKLTSAQRKLCEENFPLALWIGSKLARKLKIQSDPVISSAQWGLICAAKGYKPEIGPFKSYASRSIKNKIYEDIRKEQRDRKRDQLTITINIESKELDPEKEKIIECIFSKINEQEAELIEDYFYRNLCLAQIAEKTGQTYKATACKYYKLIKKLKRIIK